MGRHDKNVQFRDKSSVDAFDRASSILFQDFLERKTFLEDAWFSHEFSVLEFVVRSCTHRTLHIEVELVQPGRFDTFADFAQHLT